MNAINFSDANRSVIDAYRDNVAMRALGDPLPVAEWKRLMVHALSDPTDASMLPTYNNFDPLTVADALARFQITLQPGREYSVVVYVRGDPDALRTIAAMAERKLFADEVHFCERLPYTPGIGDGGGEARKTPDVLRLWWD